jgi:hypothetical protein
MKKICLCGGLTNSGSYTVESFYLDLLNDNTKYRWKYILNMKVPLNIKVFMWFLHRKVILTKHNLINRNLTRVKNVEFVVTRSPYNMFFSSVHLLKLFGILFI